MSVAGAPPQPAALLDVASLAREPSRLGRALALLGEQPGRVGAPDLAGLVRAHLVAKAYREGFVPAGPPWPEPAHWRAAGVDASPLDGGFHLRPGAWLPDWLEARGRLPGEPPDLAPAQKQERRWTTAVPGDPFLPAVGGYEDYRSPGQREALRAVLAARPGRTVVAVLPTGSGKTLALTGPARLAHLAHGAQTAMIVPTVALALDIERRLQAETGADLLLAYHGGLATEEKSGFRQRIRSGEQWLVVTSPEAVCISLSMALEEAAAVGRLRYLAVDEAHVVTEWGDSFRPAFQALAGVRRRLLAASDAAGRPLTTVLLTGTLDDHGLRTLRRLFAEEEPILVAAQCTRPEPAYWHQRCDDEDEKRRRLLEAVRHLPKPLLVYATLKTSTASTNTGQVESWLRQAGFTRLLRVDGSSSAATRRQAVAGLRLAGEPTGDLDVVVANSAFGLGVDIEDIRAVVHVCIPETIDRFYQEVGRAGRDGRATASLLLWTDADKAVAKDMSRASSIGDELGWKRWDAMRNVDRLDNGHLPVSLTAFHPGITYPGSDANRMWNLHTLTTMERAGMVRVHWATPPAVDADAGDDAMDHAFETYRSTVEVEVLQGDLGSEDVFRKRFRDARDAGISHAAATLASVGDLLADTATCTNRRFAALYALHPGRGNRFGVDDQCGGCPGCRAARARIRLLHTPSTVDPPDAGRPAVTDVLAGLLGDGSASVWYKGDVAVPWRDLSSVVRRMVEHGIRHLVLPPGAPAGLVDEAMSASPDRWVCRSDLHHWAGALTVAAMATLVVVPPGAPPAMVEAVRLRVQRHPAAVAVVPHNLPDAPDAKHFLREVLHPSYSVDATLARL